VFRSGEISLEQQLKSASFAIFAINQLAYEAKVILWCNYSFRNFVKCFPPCFWQIDIVGVEVPLPVVEIPSLIEPTVNVAEVGVLDF
jgi:hypothetical protein